MLLEGDGTEKNAAGNAEQKPAIEGSGAENKVPPTGAPPEPPKPPCAPYHSNNQAHERREKAKLVLEIAGVLILIVYTAFTALQWAQIRWTNRLTREALDGNGSALQQTLAKLQGQIDQEGRQADNTQTLADRMKDQAKQTKIIAAQTTVSADAATSAAQTAKETLEISERANVTIEEPILDTGLKALKLPLVNSGHVAAEQLVATVHQAFYDFPNPSATIPAERPTEVHWHNSRYSSVATGNHDTIAIPFPKLDQPKYESGSQILVVVGQLSYNDGIPGTPTRVWEFCFRSYHHQTMGISFFSPCDSGFWLPKLKTADGYPANEQKDANPN